MQKRKQWKKTEEEKIPKNDCMIQKTKRKQKQTGLKIILN